MHEERHLETAFQHCGEAEPFPFGAVAPPIYQTSLFASESLRQRYDHRGSQRYHYSRVSNPTLELAEQKLALLEGTERALCFASGMGAISSAILTLPGTGDHVICVEKVNHPDLPSHPQHPLAQRQMRGYGSLFSFETHPISAEQAYAFTDALSLFRFGPSWGGYESLLLGWQQGEVDEHGRAPWLFRIYIGLEHPDDLIRDLARALPSLKP